MSMSNTKADLADMCKSLGIDVQDGMTKSQMVSLIKEHKQQQSLLEVGLAAASEESSAGPSNANDSVDETELSVTSLNVQSQEAQQIKILQLQLQLAEKQLAIEEKRVQLQAQTLAANHNASEKHSSASRDLRHFLPSMDSQEVHAFFIPFERALILHDCNDKLEWAKLLVG